MTSTQSHSSWGLFPRVYQSPLIWEHRHHPLPQNQVESLLCYGLGRSYGDSCLNAGGHILRTKLLDHFLEFDRVHGILRCEAGVSFADILQVIVPAGWFLPVTPGTKFVTVGGAIANDVHGKNHHCDGTFGHHVLQFELLRSDQQRLICSRTKNPAYFHATIGGLGLTGAITWAEFKLKKISSDWIKQEIIKFHNLKEFFALSKDSEQFEYTVSWVDCLARNQSLGRGHFIRGRHAGLGEDGPKTKNSRMLVPFFLPEMTLNPLTVNIFNKLYFHKHIGKSSTRTVGFDPFFYPLDAIGHWNRIYGKRGFLQWQCVVPFQDGEDAIREIFTRIANSRLGSFLAVLKTFGKIPSLGLLSFPREGVTLALDFPNVGQRLMKLLDTLDQIVLESHGAIYPAKDARMTPNVFRASFPKISEFNAYRDPKFSSSFWRRVTKES